MNSLRGSLRDDYYAEYEEVGSHCISVKSRADNKHVVEPVAWSPGNLTFKDRVDAKMGMLFESLREQGCLRPGI
jgi:hypothetical protein